MNSVDRKVNCAYEKGLLQGFEDGMKEGAKCAYDKVLNLLKINIHSIAQQQNLIKEIEKLKELE